MDATLWCTAAIGALAGLGHLGLAAMGAEGVLSANLILRPVAHWINRVPVHSRCRNGFLKKAYTLAEYASPRISQGCGTRVRIL